MVLGIIVTLLGMLGIYGFFTHNLIFLAIGGIAAIVENLIGVFSGQQKSLMTPIIASILGVIYGTSQGWSIWIGLFIGLTFETVIMGVLGWITLLIFISKES